MDKLFIKEITIPSNLGLRTSFNIPIEYKKVKGMFLTYPSSNVELRMEMKINQKEVINKLFDPNLMRFNGYLSRNDVALDINEVAMNCSVDVTFTHKSGSQYPVFMNMYFIVD